MKSRLNLFFDKNSVKIIEILDFNKCLTLKNIRKLSKFDLKLVKNILKELILRKIVVFNVTQNRTKKTVEYEISHKNLRRLFVFPFYLNFIVENYSIEEAEFFSSILSSKVLSEAEDFDLELSNILLGGIIESNLNKNGIPQPKKLKTALKNAYQINFENLENKIFQSACESFLCEKFGIKNLKEFFNEIKSFKELEIVKILTHKKFLIEELDGKCYLNYKEIRREIIENFIKKTLNENTKRVFNFFKTKKTTTSDDLHLNLLLKKLDVKIHLLDLMKKGFLHIITGGKANAQRIEFCKSDYQISAECERKLFEEILRFYDEIKISADVFCDDTEKLKKFKDLMELLIICTAN